MKLGWYLNRLRAMEPAELLHRVAEATHRAASRHRHEGWVRYPAAAFTPLPGLRGRIERADDVQRRAIAAAADCFRSGEFAALGRAWPRLDTTFPADTWRLDPVTGTLWPGADSYCFDIEFRHGGSRGDVKYVWEFNRLQFLEPLAAYALLAGDSGSLAVLDAAIASWHAANPPFRGIAWASGIEVALRAISLAFAASLVGDRLSPGAMRQVGEILNASSFWLARFPSKYSSANNHRIAELAGLYLIGMTGGAEPAAVRAALLDEVHKQILPDGSGAEQTPTYTAFTAEMALLCATVARAAGRPFPAAFDARLGAFAGFVHWLGGDGATPAIGDDDEGRVLTLLAHEVDYPRSIAAAIAGYLGTVGAMPASGDFRALLFGAPTAPAPPPAGLKTFETGGTSIWHGPLAGHAVGLVFDHGPLGYLSIAAHGHADALSLLLAIDGEPVLVDPGTFLYGSGGAWRRWFRSTPAHNTLNIEGASQSIAVGPFNWAAHAETRLRGAGWPLAASHDGYLKRFGVRHQREIVPEPDGLLVTDRLLGPPRTAELVFQLAAGFETSIGGNVATIARAGQHLLRIEFPDAAVTASTGGDVPGPGGWVSPRFGDKRPAPRLAWHGRIGPDGVATRLRIAPTPPLDTPPHQT